MTHALAADAALPVNKRSAVCLATFNYTHTHMCARARAQTHTRMDIRTVTRLCTMVASPARGARYLRFRTRSLKSITDARTYTRDRYTTTTSTDAITTCEYMLARTCRCSRRGFGFYSNCFHVVSRRTRSHKETCQEKTRGFSPLLRVSERMFNWESENLLRLHFFL